MSEGRAGLEPARWYLTGTCSAAELPTRFAECPVGIEPTSPAWKAGTFAARPRARSSISCGGRNRTCVRAVNSRLPVPARVPPQSKKNSQDGWIRTSGLVRPKHADGQAFARPETRAPSGSRTRTSAMARRQAAATSWARFAITKLSKSQSTGWDSNPRRRITGAESWPLDDQCLLFSGTGGT